ncbi:MAG TPA: universal stress protein [Xanthobacteraceae bacterium]|nr:universal stress protein [Xanthobacteraceae bacterium]
MNVTAPPIIHPTDFSDLSRSAFTHALRISLAAKCKLYIAHIADRKDANEWQSFPHVRQTLARWGLLEAGASTAAIFERLGIEVAKVEIGSRDPIRGLTRFLAGHPSDLMVLATQGRDGLPGWFRPSIAEAMSRRARTQTLFIPGHGAGFVDSASGELRLGRILIPVDHSPPPVGAIRAIQSFYRMLRAKPDIRILHIGTDAPVLATVSTPSRRTPVDVPIEVRGGNVVDGILQAATEMGANLIGMATAGHRGLLDVVRGSTMERVLRQSPCPVLAIPVSAPQ